MITMPMFLLMLFTGLDEREETKSVITDTASVVAGNVGSIDKLPII